MGLIHKTLLDARDNLYAKPPDIEAAHAAVQQHLVNLRKEFKDLQELNNMLVEYRKKMSAALKESDSGKLALMLEAEFKQAKAMEGKIKLLFGETHKWLE